MSGSQWGERLLAVKDPEKVSEVFRGFIDVERIVFMGPRSFHIIPRGNRRLEKLSPMIRLTGEAI